MSEAGKELYKLITVLSRCISARGRVTLLAVIVLVQSLGPGRHTAR